ncbi:DUF4249 domain-containing protein [Psychroflexus montanilacus]|uniref:DUF4249 domain-containing protein n=1 Tax=Psychroflexus montanilacus TaxID=2873598 RepID=UPI001CCA0192|nr:DUF4249 domain-containing protein [Psychroflexus montanilacus]MBZ9651148.1 DUF4249 domain-containing protein [Psychroflexus montanilacus]
MKSLKKYELIPLKMLLCLSLAFSLMSCVEEIELRTQDFESIIVFEANITNEFKQQEVFISRTFRFEDDGPSKETNADVRVLSNGSPFADFIEIEPGRYLSRQPFAAQENISYSLEVTTRDGRNYISEPSQLPGVAEIESMSVEPSQDGFGNTGVSILVNSTGNSAQGNFYKFEYSETYKIIAPFWRSDNLVPDSQVGPCDFSIQPREEEERVCFSTNESIDIILAETLSLPEDKINNFETRFIRLDNTIIAHRYSILLKQFVIPSTANDYFQKRRELSSQDNLFSQAQPGFLEGNITSVESPEEERVIGVFYTSTVSENRFYFNWVDLFPNQDPPEIPCRTSAPPLTNIDGSCLLEESVIANRVRYWEPNLNQGENEGPYVVVPRECGDCTAIGSNIVPDFWEE